LHLQESLLFLLLQLEAVVQAVQVQAAVVLVEV
jgi:hypothetical protein